MPAGAGAHPGLSACAILCKSLRGGYDADELFNLSYSSFQIHATRFAIDMKKKNGTNGKDGKDGTNGAIQSQAPFVPLFPFIPFFFS